MTCRSYEELRRRLAARQPDDPGFCQETGTERSIVLQSLRTRMHAKAGARLNAIG